MDPEGDIYFRSGFARNDRERTRQNDLELETMPNRIQLLEAFQRSIRDRITYLEDHENDALINLDESGEVDLDLKQFLVLYLDRCVSRVSLVTELLVCIPLQMACPWWKVIIVYFAGVVAGTLVALICDSASLQAGPNGGVYAINTAHLVIIIRDWDELMYPLMHLFIFILLISPDIGRAIFSRYCLGLDQDIDYAANIASTLAGLLIGIWIFNTIERAKIVKQLWWATFLCYVLLMATAILVKITWTDYF